MSSFECSVGQVLACFSVVLLNKLHFRLHALKSHTQLRRLRGRQLSRLPTKERGMMILFIPVSESHAKRGH